MPHDIIILIIECILISLAAGMVFGIFGSGSGLIMTPGFYYLLRHFHMASSHQMQIAVASTAAASAVLGFFSAKVQYKKKNVSSEAVKAMFIPLFIGTVAAILLASIIPSAILKKTFGVVVILVSIWLWQYKMEKDAKTWSLKGIGNFVTSFLIGVAWFLLGVAVFLAPYLLKCGIPMRKAVGSASVTASLFSFIAALLFMLIGYFVIGANVFHVGYVNLLILLVAVIPGALGGYFGSHISVRLPQKHLKHIYAVLVLIVGVLMIV